jgi:hypothetical protein
VVERKTVRELAVGPRGGAKLAGRQEMGLMSAKTGLSASNSHNASTPQSPEIKTIGWRPTCSCHRTHCVACSCAEHGEVRCQSCRGYCDCTGSEPIYKGLCPTGQSIVLDPFCGSGTTGVVALRHGRSFVGIDLNREYLELARRRICDDAPLFNGAAEVAA